MYQAPQKQFVVADPRKLTFFAQANGARFGIQNAAGALAGLGNVVEATPEQLNQTRLTQDIAGGMGTFLNSLFGKNGAASPPPPPPPVYRADTSVMGLPGWIAVGLGVAVAGFVGYKLVKKGR